MWGGGGGACGTAILLQVLNVDIKVDNNKENLKHKGTTITLLGSCVTMSPLLAGFGFAALSTPQLTTEVCGLSYIEVRGKNVSTAIFESHNLCQFQN